MPITLTVENFESEVLKASEPVLVDFWAAWCMPCKMLSPTIDDLSQEFKGKAKVAKLNVDDNRELATKYGIMTIPTVYIFKDGEVVEQIVAPQPKSIYANALNKYL